MTMQHIGHPLARTLRLIAARLEDQAVQKEASAQAWNPTVLATRLMGEANGLREAAGQLREAAHEVTNADHQ